MTTSIQAVDFTSFVFASNDEIKTSSLLIAEKFGKLHKNVLQSIERLECSEQFSQLNFQPAEYIDEQGKPRTMYEMTKDGFMFLVMGFTGKPAAQVKEAYINAFNQMHDKLFPKTPYGLKDLPPDMTLVKKSFLHDMEAELTRLIQIQNQPVDETRLTREQWLDFVMEKGFRVLNMQNDNELLDLLCERGFDVINLNTHKPVAKSVLNVINDLLDL